MKRKKPFGGFSFDDLIPYIGKRVKKESGKPFSDGEKVALISGVSRNPHSNNWAFTFVGAELCDAHRCIMAEEGES